MATRRKRNLLDAVLLSSASAVCVLDADRRLRFFSPGMARLTGWEADSFEGLICEPFVSASATPLELLRSAPAPSHDVLNGNMQTVDVVLPRRHESGLKVALTFLPISDEDGSISRILVVSDSTQSGRPAAASLTQKLHAEVTSLRLEFRRRFSEQTFIGDCPAIHRALAQAELLKNSDCGYGIVGPVGTGRRHLAGVIHTSGNRHERSFVAVDCRLLTAEHLLDTLRRLRRDSDEHAGTPHQHVGTLVFSDAERCPREVQQWMLADLQQEIEGVRMVAVGSEPLVAAEADGWVLPEFRELFETVQIALPSLHHRGDDISLLAQHFIEECRRTLETSAEGMSSAFEDELRFYRWPGNVRELRQVIADACQSSFSETLETDDLPFAFRAGLEAQQLPRLPQDSVQSLEEIMERFESDVLLATLNACDGNKAEAARRLGMTRPRLYRRLRTLGLDDGVD